MSAFSSIRCPRDAGFLHHSYIAYNGIDIYACTQEGLVSAGRYFICTTMGAIEVTPKREGKAWSYEIVDQERRKHQEDRAKIEEELAARVSIWNKSMKIRENLRHDDGD